MRILLRITANLMFLSVLAFTACDGGGGAESDQSVTFSGVTQSGGTSGTADTTSLTLTFSADPGALTADNITVTGATKGG